MIFSEKIVVSVVMIIKTENKTIKINQNIIDTFCKHIQHNSSDIEAGGIIIGRENKENDNIILDYVTEPFPKDTRSCFRFHRKDKAHVNFYKKIYNDNNKVHAYYGEWHTHYEDIPHYSSIDLKNWQRIASECPLPYQYHVIVGRKYLVLWQMRKTYNKPLLIYRGEII